MVTGVTARRELSERAVELGAELVLVHHGLFWNFHPTGLTPLLAERLRPLFKHDINLAALPPAARRAPGGRQQRDPRARARVRGDRQPFGALQGHVHRLPRHASPSRLTAGRAARARARGDRPRAAAARAPGRSGSRSIGIVSGSAADTLHEAAAAGLDAFLTGEPREHITAEAAELGMHFVAAGHYATETFGVRALGDLLAERFGVEHVFVDLANPV